MLLEPVERPDSQILTLGGIDPVDLKAQVSKNQTPSFRFLNRDSSVALAFAWSLFVHRHAEYGLLAPGDHDLAGLFVFRHLGPCK